jgi:hypothetical protein
MGAFFPPVCPFVEVDDGKWEVYFGPLRLGRFHERTLLVEDALRPTLQEPVTYVFGLSCYPCPGLFTASATPGERTRATPRMIMNAGSK